MITVAQHGGKGSMDVPVLAASHDQCTQGPMSPAPGQWPLLKCCSIYTRNDYNSIHCTLCEAVITGNISISWNIYTLCILK